MKKILTTIFALMATVIAVQAEEVPLVGNVYARQTTLLNGDWNYIVDVQEEGYYDYRMNVSRWGFFQNAKPQRPEDLIEYDFDKAAKMRIPGDWNTQDEKLFFYEGTVWFKKSFTYHKQEGRRTLLYFGAVNYDSHVYVNTKHVAHHIGGFTPFNMDVTNELKEGENVVIVKVDNKRHRDNVPTQIFDWWNYGGITRDVMLVDVAPTYIENYKWELCKTQAKNKKQTISLEGNLNKAEAGKQVVISIPELKLKQTATTDAEGRFSATFTVQKSKLTLWCPNNPKLYNTEMTIGGETLKDQVGFRTIETRQADFAERQAHLPPWHQHP